MMKRRVVITIVLVVLVALAGCGGGTGTPDDGSTPTGTPTSTTVDSTPAATATASPTPTPSENPFTSALSDHKGKVGAQEGVIITINQQLTQDDQEVSTTGTISVDPTTGERYDEVIVKIDDDRYRLEKYSPPDVEQLKTCTATSSGCTSVTTDTVVDLDGRFADPITHMGELEAAPSFEPQGLVQTDDGLRQKFVAEGTDVLPAGGTTAEYDSFRMVLFFDPDTDLLKRFVYEGTYTDNGVTKEVSTTVTYEYGPVDVQEPEWYDEEDE